VAPETTNYVRKVTLRESDIQRRLREETDSATGDFNTMLSSPEEMQFIQLLIKLIGAKKTLEVGTFTGYSALCVALALPDDGKVVALDVSEEWANIGKKYWQEAGVFDKIDLRIKPAVESLDELIQTDGGSFDFAFIDADKTNYQTYVDKVHTLLKQNGLVAIDNTLWSGRVYDDSNQEPNTVALRSLNEFLLKDQRWDIAVTTIADGVTFLRKL
jgi:predicted O-methyltransferase YrrM